jgi:transposase
VTGLTRASWRSCYAPTNSSRSITESIGYAPCVEWLAKIVEPGVRVRAQRLHQQLDGLQPVRLEARRELLRESHKHPAVKLLRQIPSIGPIRAALLVVLLQTLHRFRTKRQLWAYSGFAVETQLGQRQTVEW